MFQITQQFVVDAALVAKANRGLAFDPQDFSRHSNQDSVMVSVTVGGVALQSRQPVTVVLFEVIVNFVQVAAVFREPSADIPVPPRE
jgi:hypothetical protein